MSAFKQPDGSWYIETDNRARLPMARTGAVKAYDTFLAELRADGSIVLTPAKVVKR